MCPGAARCPTGVSRALSSDSEGLEDSPGPSEQLGETLLESPNFDSRGKQLRFPAIRLHQKQAEEVRSHRSYHASRGQHLPDHNKKTRRPHWRPTGLQKRLFV